MRRRDGNGVAVDGSIDHCNVCIVGKKSPAGSHQEGQTRRHHGALSTALYTQMGPFKPEARGGYEYVSRITDQFTKWTAVYSLCSKAQAVASLQLYVTSTAIPFGSRIVTWRADKGGEYTGEDFKAYCQETGTTRQLTATNTPIQIGVSERVGRTLCAMVRCMRVDSGLPQLFWGECMMAASSYICNRVPHSALNMETPYKKLYGKDADLSYLRSIAQGPSYTSKTQTS